MAAFRVLAYTIDVLIECLADGSLASREEIQNKLHCQYFSQYFSDLEAKTIVVEPDYVDHDFLEDFSAYYVRCFQLYQRATTRLHFFSVDFTEDEFRNFLVKPIADLDTQKLQDSYLGFVVVKPLPQTIVGRTCLKTYPDDEGRRHFPILRKYSANLFGIPLEIDSLAYQEQDTVVAACATSALWSCFQGTGKLFQHAIPSPVEITKAATSHVPENLPANSARALPNNGLTATQMALAVRDIGLEPYIVGTPSEYPYVLKSTLYAYLSGKIPSILVFSLIKFDNETQIPIGNHAVAVTGFSLGCSAPQPWTENGFLLRASRIDKLYAHDDQVGPFARMEYAQSTQPYLASSWGLNYQGKVHAAPLWLLVPLYHKIRIPFEVVHDAILIVDLLIEQLRPQLYPDLPRPEWDIYLTTVSDFKKDVFVTMRPTLGAALEHHLTVNLPKFLWRVTAWCGAERHLELLFDATGIAQQKLLVHVIKPQEQLPTLIASMAHLAIEVLGNVQAKAIFRHFRQ